MPNGSYRLRLLVCWALPKVLVVDDERVIADTLAIILNQHGFEASAAYDGTEAVEQAYSLRPDMIICDVMKPDMNGVEAAILVREFLPSCKILLFSGQAQNLYDCAQEHGLELWPKPVHPQKLLTWLGYDSSFNVESVRPVAVPYVAPSPPPELPKPIPVRIEAPAKAAKERKKPLFTPQSLVGAIIWYLVQYLVKFAGFVLVLMAVFGILSVIGYGIDQVIVWTRTPHIQRQHYTDPKPDNDDTRFRLLKT